MAVSSDGGREVIIGLDVGTSAAKAVAYGIGDPFRARASRPLTLRSDRPAEQTVDPMQVIDAAEDALTEVASACAGHRIIGIAVSAAMHGLIGIDRHRAPVTPILTWADARATEALRAIRGTRIVDDLHQQTGTPVHPMSAALKLRWMAEHEPDIKDQARAWLGIKDWLLLRLTGELITERSSASASGLVDRRTGEWSPLALGFASVDAARLPPILEPTAILGMDSLAVQRIGVPATVPIIVGAADGPLANVGTGALDPDVAALSMGTSGAIRVLVPLQPAVLDPALFCYFLNGGLSVLGGALSTGGVLLPWLASLLGSTSTISTAEVLELAMSAPPGSDGLVMLAHLLPERAPLWDPDLPGAYLGLRIDHGPAHLARAAVEGVAVQMGLIAARLAGSAPISRVLATGGAFASPVWAPVLAAALDRPITVTTAEDGSALGAAALGLLALGRAPDLSACRAMLVTHEDRPLMVAEPDPAYVQVLTDVRANAVAMIDALSAERALLSRPVQLDEHAQDDQRGRPDQC